MEKVKISFFLLLFSGVLFVIGINKVPVIDRDEAHFAQASKQMMQTGNYFQIRFQDRTRFQKPPGINWLQAASVQSLSHAETNQIWPYRIPSALGAFLSVLLTYLFASRFVGGAAAALAAGLLASTLLLVVEAHMAVIDAMLLCSVVLMQGALWIIYQSSYEQKKIAWFWPFCFWVAMAFGVALKGVTPLIGILTVLTLYVMEKRRDWLTQLKVYQGLILFIGLTLVWLLLVNQAEHSNYLLQMVNKDLLPKLKGGHESHGKPPLFHLAILPITFWPASLFLWLGGVYAWKNRHDKIIKFLLAWLVPSWVFFECMPTKLPQYVLPLFPALAIVCALAIRQQLAMLPSKWHRFLQYLWTILSVGFGCALMLAAYWVNQEPNLSSLMISTIIIVFSGIAVFFSRQGQFKYSLAAIFALAALTYPLIFNQLLPSLKPIWLTSNLTQYIDRTKLSSQQPLLAVGFDEPSLVFNLDTTLVRFVDISTAAEQLRINPKQLAVFDNKSLQAWSNRPNNIKILAQVRGFNYSKGRWIKLFLIGQEEKQRDGAV
ncbi:dolichyl-phosphate-mannose-protein mannosyltransferase [Legionella beliardensis]|uniref:Dolichyl-phosphate-mannose-protein mannosyltransferase n=1 Tax=Legionella beliardensis TaxID=91822 RepID=A0A378I0W5_9GAMM|nr:glycosyltransferase family 39 protein [Legionella beliardensis]STX28236.1 dolichyl-phosphate-mannose-protein mannosyltransferase [Legionella beliardensis]